MECEESFITMKLIWRGYLVPSLGICANETPTEIGLTFMSAMTNRRLFGENILC